MYCASAWRASVEPAGMRIDASTEKPLCICPWLGPAVKPCVELTASECGPDSPLPLVERFNHHQHCGDVDFGLRELSGSLAASMPEAILATSYVKGRNTSRV
jgi:hypothetical protein